MYNLNFQIMKDFFNNPFHRIAGWQAFWLSVPFMALKWWLSSLYNLRFDGVMDAHFYANDITVLRSLADECVNLSVLSLVFYLGARVAKAHHTRFQDIIGTLAFARIPLVFVPLVNMGGYFSKLSIESSEDLVQLFENIQAFSVSQWLDLAGLALLMLVFVVWTLVWKYKAIAVSTHIHRASLPYVFVFCLLIAEVLSLVLLRWIWVF